MDLFRIIPENFFSLLASKNKRIYVNLIVEAYKVYESGSILGIEKKIVVDELIHYLENYSYEYTNEDIDDEEASVKSKRDLANYVLRRLEECGWIYVDVSDDYEEILNFSDAGITFTEAIIELAPSFISEGYYDEESAFERNDEYQGYIYTIYSLLTNNVTDDYSMIMREVYRNTKLLLSSIRRLDARMKDYIASVVLESNVKDLMENLMNYREDFVENGYAKLKMSDNINRYRLKIITALEEYQNNEDLMIVVATKNYPKLSIDKSLIKANRDIDEIIDVFNALDDIISKIDEKTRTYINSTIGKIKFLLSEDDNVIGKLNKILKHVYNENKTDHVDRAVKLLNTAIHLGNNRAIDERSLYVPRGVYKRNFNLLLDDSRLEGFDIEADFFDAYQAPYQEGDTRMFLENHLANGDFYGNEVIKNETDKSICMMSIYSILFALENENDYDVEVLNSLIFNKHLKMKNFVIRKKVK